jgi:hypothetical protein
MSIDTSCPGCGKRWLKGETELLPEPGDVTICVGCGRVLRFRRGMFGYPLMLELLSERDERALRRAVRERLRDLQPADA